MILIESLAETAYLKYAEECASVEFHAEVEGPHSGLYDFNGTVYFQGSSLDSAASSVDGSYPFSAGPGTPRKGTLRSRMSPLKRKASKDFPKSDKTHIRTSSKHEKLAKVNSPTEAFTSDNTIIADLSDAKHDIVADKCTRVSIDVNGLLLRGCAIKNTEWVIGLVLYVGTETKLSLNSDKTPSKRSAIEKKMNVQMYFSLLIYKSH